MAKKKEPVKCYKFSEIDGRFWSIIASDDDIVAKEEFKDFYNYGEKKFNKEIKIERLSPSYKIFSPHNMTSMTVGAVCNSVKFFPRVIADANGTN